MTLKERPILFNGPMVRALLDGRKTQTRRTMKPQPNADGMCPPTGCPYGAPGDLLWVREANCPADPPPRGAPAMYAADWAGFAKPDRDWDWTPSIYMPRASSRITLRVTEVRFERLNDISERDAMAEGAAFYDGRPIGHHGWRHDLKDVHADARSSFARLWESINGAGSWDANPWVWAVSFERVAP